MGSFYKTGLKCLAAGAVLAGAVAAHAQEWRVAPMHQWDGGRAMEPNTGNTSAPSNWRLTAGSTFNGVQGAFDGTALLLFTASGLSGTYACSGSLMNGGEYVLTAAHCVDGLISMSVQFGYTNNVALQTRSVVAAYQAPGWDGTLDTGADLALVKLNAPVSNLPTYSLSTGSDLGKQYIMTGYGTSGNGSTSTAPNWNDSAYGHFGYNTFDSTSDVVFGAWDATHAGAGTYTPPTFGHTYVTDFDAPSTFPNAANYNTLQRISDNVGGGSWTNTSGEGLNEALIAGGDSGGGDFVWDGSKWVLSAVHSWGWQFCGGRISPTCDLSTTNSSSYGDLSGSTAVYEHLDWIYSYIGTPVPEPGSYALMGLGLFAVVAAARRRRA